MSNKTTKITLNKKGQVIKKEASRDLTVDSIREKCGGHWGECPGYPSDDWKYLVSNNETRLGYLEWILGSIEANGEV